MWTKTEKGRNGAETAILWTYFSDDPQATRHFDSTTIASQILKIASFWKKSRIYHTVREGLFAGISE